MNQERAQSLPWQSSEYQENHGNQEAESVADACVSTHLCCKNPGFSKTLSQGNWDLYTK